MSFSEFQFKNTKNISKKAKGMYWVAIMSQQLKDLKIGRQVIVEIIDGGNNNELIYTGLGKINDIVENTKQFDKKVAKILKEHQKLSKNNKQESVIDLKTQENIKRKQFADALELIKLEQLLIELNPFDGNKEQFGFIPKNNFDTCKKTCILKLKPEKEKILGGIVHVIPFSIAKGNKKLRAMVYIGCDPSLGECFKTIPNQSS